MKNLESLNRLFSSKIRTKLLNIFLSTPNARFYIRELERKIKEEAKNVSRELKNLEILGLLISELKGNQKYYSVNEDFFLYPELKAIFIKTSGIEVSFKDAINKLDEIEAAFIYGTYAEGKKSEGSIDVMIIGKPDTTKLDETIKNLEEKLNREINYMSFDREEFDVWKKTEKSFITEILSKKKIMLKGSEDEI